MLLKNWKIFAGAFALILVVVLIVLIGTSIQEKRDIAAKTALNNAADEQALQLAVDKYNSHPAAVSARFKLAELHTAKEEYQKAAEILQDIANDSDTDIFIRSKAEISAAYLWDKAGEKDKALEALNTISSNFNLEPVLRAEASYAQAGIYLMQKEYAKARSALANINMAKQDSQMDPVYARWVEKAAALMDRLPAEEVETADKK